MNARYLTVDVFTDRRFGGNQLAVFPDARQIKSDLMPRIAQEFNYSETTFVLPPERPEHTARVRIFTRQTELPFAGHPNVGTAFVLATDAERAGTSLGVTVMFEETAGLVPVDLMRDAAGRVVGATLTAPQPLSVGARVPAEVVAACAGLERAAVLTAAHEPTVTSVGLPFVIAEVTGDALTIAKPDTAAFADAARTLPIAGGGRFSLFLYARAAGGPGAPHLRARMFSPLGGTVEDPATGSANAALVGLLASFDPAATTTLALDVVQGVEMGRPSRLALGADKRAGAVVRVRVGGRCAPVMEGTLRA